MYGLGFGAFRHAMIGSINSGGGYGALTTAWITATGETDPTIISALNTFESDTSSISSKLKAVYPFVGGNATKHSYNFANTALYQITWNGGITHAATGVLGNGTNGYGNTNLFPSSIFSVGNLGATYYSRTNRQKDYGFPFGCQTNFSTPDSFMMLARDTTNTMYARIGSYAFVSTTATVTDSSGIFTGNRTNAVNQQIYRNGTQIGSSAVASITIPASFEIYILALNQVGTASFFDNEEFGFMAFHDGLTSGEVTTLYNAINTFKTTLSR